MATSSIHLTGVEGQGISQSGR